MIEHHLAADDDMNEVSHDGPAGVPRRVQRAEGVHHLRRTPRESDHTTGIHLSLPHNCFKDGYHVSEFTEEYICHFCFATQRVNFASVRDWQYKADGLFRIPDSAQGSVAVILSLWRFEHFAHIVRGCYLTSRNLRPIGIKNVATELDYAYLLMDMFDTSYDLVLGQSTRFGDFTDDDVRRMAELSDRFERRPYLAFSTLRDRYSDADRIRLHDMARRDIA